MTCPPPQKEADGWVRDVDFVVTGRAFEALLADHESGTSGGWREGWSVLEAVVIRGAIYARMSPTHKQRLVGCLMDLNMVVCM